MPVKRGTVLLRKYLVKERIGGTGPNDIYLVEDENHEQYALRVISRDKLFGGN